ncbi:MAG: NAD(P)H-hydrate dehydratase [Thermodesulfovibrionales bacterium]|nr:NAD(P)H-hydrate dehydratase [Thermodesulfovibrionales bacterium]
MKVVTAAEMRDIDRKTIKETGIPGFVLIERAGLAVVAMLKERFGRRRVIVLSGRGNNGADGMVAARALHNEGWDVKVFLSGRYESLRGDALQQYSIARKCGVSIEPLEKFLMHHSLILNKPSLIIDALLGTGLDKNIGDELSDVIEVTNNSAMPVISIDIPTGISSDTGQIMGNAVLADYTLTFGLPKRGHFLYPGAEYTGKLFIENIGFPEHALRTDKIATDLIEKKAATVLVPERPEYSHKGTYGHVLVIAGSRGKTGAALMAAKACLRTGAGLVTLGVPASLAGVFQSRVTEEMTLLLADKGDGTLSRKASKQILDFVHEKADVLAIGPGLGVSDETEQLVVSLIENAGVPMVIDADGINSLKGRKPAFSKARSPVILTPHPGEMARLLSGRKDVSVKRVEEDRIGIAQFFARKTGTYLVLKGVPTLTAAPDGKVFLNSTGNPGMASGGTGDVLTGMISGLVGQKISPLHACVLGVYLHGLAADIAALEKGPHSLIATDIIEHISSAFLSLKNNG